jgi:hypothetical protein
MVDRLTAAAPGGWKDITKLVRKPADPDPGDSAAEEQDALIPVLMRSAGSARPARAR